MNQINRKERIDFVIGLSFTAVATGFLAWSLFSLITGQVLANAPAQQDSHLENKAMERLRDVARAQAKFIEKDRNQDGRREFAKYLVHLWQSVSEKDSSPVSLRFIDQDMAFVSSSKAGLGGYKFKMIRYRGGESSKTLLDFSREWAAVAYPVSKKDGLSTLVIFADGSVWSKNTGGTSLSSLPGNLKVLGWTARTR